MKDLCWFTSFEQYVNIIVFRSKDHGWVPQKRNFYKKTKDKLWKETWSKMDFNAYQKIIDGIKENITETDGLWSIEKHWKGHQ